MARKKNATFQGVSWSDARPNAATYKRAIEDVIGDLALIADKVRGTNAEASTINHGGTAGRGAVIRHVLASQWIGRSVRLTNPVASTNGGYNTFYLIAVPIFIPAGITKIAVEVYGRDILSDVKQANARAFITDTSRAEIDSATFEATENSYTGSSTRYTAHLDVTTGKRLLFVEMEIQDEQQNQASGTLESWAVTTGGVAARFTPPPFHEGDAFIVRAPATSGDGQGVNVRNYDASLFANEAPISAYITQGAAVDLASLYEYVTGWPAGGNGAYVHEDQTAGLAADLIDPHHSRFLAHTRASYSAEPLMKGWPLICAAHGSIGSDGRFGFDPDVASGHPISGMLDWGAPVPVDIGGVTLSSLPLIIPDLSTDHRLKAMVLLGSNGRSNANQWSVDLSLVGAATSEVLGALAAIDATNDLWLAEDTNLSTLLTSASHDTVDRLRVDLSRTGIKPDADEICLLGTCLYYEDS